MMPVLTIWFVLLAWGPENGSRIHGEQIGPFFSAEECNAYWGPRREMEDRSARAFPESVEYNVRKYEGCIVKYEGLALKAYKEWESFYTQKHQYGTPR